MNLQATKIELIEMLISTRKITVSKKIKAILEEELEHLTEEEYTIIDARRESHVKQESRSYTRKEARQKIQNRQ